MDTQKQAEIYTKAERIVAEQQEKLEKISVISCKIKQASDSTTSSFLLALFMYYCTCSAPCLMHNIV